MDKDRSGNVTWGEFRAFALEVSKSARDHITVDDAASSVREDSAPDVKPKVAPTRKKRSKLGAKTHPARAAWGNSPTKRFEPKRPLTHRKAVIADASMRGDVNDPQMLREEIAALRKRQNSLVKENESLRVAARSAAKNARERIKSAQNEMNSAFSLGTNRARKALVRYQETILFRWRLCLWRKMQPWCSVWQTSSASSQSLKMAPSMNHDLSPASPRAGVSPRSPRPSDLALEHQNAICAQLTKEAEKAHSELDAVAEERTALQEALAKERATTEQLRSELDAVFEELMQAQCEKILADSKSRWRLNRDIEEQQKLEDHIGMRQRARRNSTVAATRLQNAIRSRKARRGYLVVKDKRTRAATRIQAQWRRMDAAKKSDAYRERANRGAVGIPSHATGAETCGER